MNNSMDNSIMNSNQDSNTKHFEAKVISDRKYKKHFFLGTQHDLHNCIKKCKFKLNSLKVPDKSDKLSPSDKKRKMLKIKKEIKGFKSMLNENLKGQKEYRKKLNYAEHKFHPWQFYQFNTRITPQLFFLLADRPLALKILAVILFCAWRKHWGVAVIRKKDLRQAVATTKKAGNKNSVNRAIKYLRSLGIIAVSKIDTTNVYIVNPDFIWQQPLATTLNRGLKSIILKKKHNDHIRFEANIKYCRKRKNNGKCSKIINKLLKVRSNSRPLSAYDFKVLTPKFTVNKALTTDESKNTNNLVKPYYKAERIDNHKRYREKLSKKVTINPRNQNNNS